LHSLVAVIIIIFLAVLLKAVLGFGEALIAMPLLTLIMGLQMAAPLVGLMAAIITSVIALSQWRHIDFRLTWRLVLASAAGIPAGLILLKIAPPELMTHGMGVLLIVYGAYTLFTPNWNGLRHPAWVYIFGFSAGVLGSAYNTSGPPVVIYATTRGWSPQRFRATLQSCFFPMSIMIITSHGLSGLWTPTVLLLFILILPAILIAFVIGNYASQYIPVEHFARLVRVGLCVLGIMLLIR
jgi:uncharacterized protein